METCYAEVQWRPRPATSLLIDSPFTAALVTVCRSFVARAGRPRAWHLVSVYFALWTCVPAGLGRSGFFSYSSTSFGRSPSVEIPLACIILFRAAIVAAWGRGLPPL